MKSLTAALILSTALAGLACADTTAPTFELHIALSDAAAAKLKESGEAITIAASKAVKFSAGARLKGAVNGGKAAAD